MSFISPSEQDNFFYADSDGLQAVGSNAEVILCQKQMDVDKEGRVQYFSVESEVSADYATFQFYFKLNGVKSIPGLDLIKTNNFPVGNSKEQFIRIPKGGILQLCAFNTAGLSKNAKGDFQGWQFGTV